ncbi:hypothetical protein K491DRAFT_772482 [Lophiostoma macrostomum CBS 122681]|uniref:Uncharacterized protein n=1 Tax=Lophiostoma macrostomum CBS 122681 TaxID=1314788 RepID=A0A6A6SIQ7_9PLEO|nr:hypothetical protein K491DRAFT_772482 [Lophiostoma macrostomum CBS 122681]
MWSKLVSNSDIRQSFCINACSAKRRKTQRADVSAPHIFSPPPSNLLSQPPALTEEALCSIQQSIHQVTELVVPDWRLSLQTYRTRNMYYASVFVDKLANLLPPIDVEVQRILGIELWDDPVAAALDRPQAATHLTRLCSLEGDWKASLNGLVRNLTDFWPGTLKTHMSKKVWNSNLKPTCQSFNDLQDEDYSGTQTPRFILAQTTLPDFNPNNAAATAAAFPGPIPSLPLYTQSHQRRLVNHQASGLILSNPHAADMGIRFPFLVVEAKGLSLNGSLISAQNQAAISGASMLTIMKDLNHQAAWNASADSNSESRTLDMELTSPSSTPLAPQLTPALCFSIVTEGPVHKLWVHFNYEDGYYIEFL